MKTNWTRNDKVRFMYETYAEITYVKIRTQVAKIKDAAYVRIELLLSDYTGSCGGSSR